MQDKRMPIGDVFTSCNWVMRDGYEVQHVATNA